MFDGGKASYPRTKLRPPETIRALNARLQDFCQMRGYAYIDYYSKLVDSAGPMSSLALSLGSGNSLHTGGSTGPGCASCSDPKMWYESDFIVKLGATFLEDLTVGLVYTAYMSPNDLFNTVQELGLSISYNDSKLLGAFALNPSLLLAGEIKGQADAGSRQGIYLQIGISPGYTFFSEAPYLSGESPC